MALMTDKEKAKLFGSDLPCELIVKLNRQELAIKEALREIKDNLTCNHPGEDNECSNIDDCVYCSLLLILGGEEC